MNVTSLEQMEQIVSNSDTLKWDGWTVVDSKPNQNGYTSVNGAFIDGRWHIEKRYEPTAQGWDIPNKFVR